MGSDCLPPICCLRPLQPRARAGPVAPSDRPEAATYAALAERLNYLEQGRRARCWRPSSLPTRPTWVVPSQRRALHHAPIAVAGWWPTGGLDAQAVMAALMHDAMEDCGVTKAQLIERFGAPTAELVDGLTSSTNCSSPREGQAESFRKMLLAMARDVRVIPDQAGRSPAQHAHHGRTPPAKRLRIARETLDIYAPIAHRLGLNQSHRELQELAFEPPQPRRHAAVD